MKDIQSKQDIEQLIRVFYDKLWDDEAIGIYFDHVKPIFDSEHLSQLVSFWSPILLYEGSYRGRVIDKHIKIDEIKRLEKSHFDRWLELFHQSIDELFQGARAEAAREKSVLMAKLILFKVEASRKPGFIA